MAQQALLEDFEKYFSELLTIHYDGTSKDLLAHEINAKAFAVSLNGYTRFIQAIGTEFIGKNIEVSIVASNNGSFKAVMKVTGNLIAAYGVLTSILSFHGITSTYIGDYLINIQKIICDYIVIHDGKTTKILQQINMEAALPEDAKKMLRRIMQDNQVRKGLDDFTYPLERRGYSRIDVLGKNDSSFSIKSSNRSAFHFTPPNIVENESFQTKVQILYLSPELTEWKFQGSRPFWAEVKDESFIERTKTKVFSELRDKFYIVSGTKKTVQKEGSKTKKITWVISNVTEVPGRHSLL